MPRYIVDGEGLGKGLSERSLSGWAVCNRLLSQLGLCGLSRARVLWKLHERVNAFGYPGEMV